MIGRVANWSHRQSCGEISLGDKAVAVHLNRPAVGLGGLAPSTTDRVLGIELPDFADPIPASLMVDGYVRQPDLIATYERPGDDHLRVQLDWRYDQQVTQAGECAGLHVWVSLQTDRLDSRPLLNVVTELSAATLLQLTPNGDWVPPKSSPEDTAGCGSAAATALLFRPQAAVDQSLLVLVMPHDVLRCRLTANTAQSGWRCDYTLLGEHLEKGVIRRAQLAVYPLTRQQDEVIAAELFAKFLGGPLPLTV